MEVKVNNNKDLNQIKVIFSFNQKMEKIECKSNEMIEKVCLEYCSRTKKDFDEFVFTLNGQIIDKEDYNKEINKFFLFGNRELQILVNENYFNSEDRKLNKKINVIFWFGLNPTKIQCFAEDNMQEVCQKFAQKSNKNLNDLKFNYRDKNIDIKKLSKN